MRLSLVLQVLGPATVAAARATDFHERLDGLPRGWQFHREASRDEPLVLHVALINQNVEAFEQRLYDISTPGSELYGNFLEGHDVESFLAPLQHSRDSVIGWLEACNISRIISDGDWVSLSTTTGAANDMLKAEFAWFHNKETGRTELRTTQYSIPDDLSKHVDFVHPTIKFPSTRELRSTIRRPSQGSKASSGAAAVTSVTPQFLLNLYNVHYGAKAKDGNSLSYASFFNESAKYSDLELFSETVAPYTAGRNFSVITFSGATNDQSAIPAVEANLDNQYTIGVGYPVPVTEFIAAGCGPLDPDQFELRGSCANEPYLRFLKGISKLSNADLPNVISISYGEDEQGWPEKMANKVCNGFAQLGARGVTVIFASGDAGPGAVCTNNNGKKKMYTPFFPATCPFVTAVGATTGESPESAAFLSGGGFSNYFTRPSYQNKAVKAYLKAHGKKHMKLFNSTGRGYPDVAAQGEDYEVADDGSIVSLSGTSAATPTFSGIVALLNSARIESGKKPLGFLNPFLYSKGSSGLTDIINGSSSGCSHIPIIVNAGFKAVAGWDPATGLGTPNFGKLLKKAAPGVKNTGGVV